MVEFLPLVFIAAAGLSTIIGALPMLKIRQLTHRTHDTTLGFVAGIMLSVAILDLLLHMGVGSGEAPDTIAIFVVLGALTIVLVMTALRRMPLPMPFVKDKVAMTKSAAFLLFISLLLHNAPEGLATGAGYSQGLTSLGHSIALAIAFQNIPEGLLVATAVMCETGSRKAGFIYAVMSAIVEPIVGFFAFFALALTPAAIGALSGFAAGAMLFVVFFQVIPESHHHGYHGSATLALLAGMAAAVIADALIGLIA